MTGPPLPLGATPGPDGTTTFCTWAPRQPELSVRLAEERRSLPMERDRDGYFTLVTDAAPAGTAYESVLPDGRAVPDPCSRHQARGVHGPSIVTDLRHPWRDGAWRGRPLSELVISEIHVGTYTPAGTFRSAIERLPALRDLGVTAIELMPVAQFPGARNWGYDGVLPFAVQDTYGGPRGLLELVDAAHELDLAVVLDVVYNHVGPEGNVLEQLAPYFTDRYGTPWGRAINVDGADSDHVRRFLVDNAIGWMRDFHVDALRLDAVHAIVDTSAITFLRELGLAKQALERSTGRTLLLIAESDLNDRRTVEPAERNGDGMDAQWLDDFHHSLHALLTGERQGYYQDFGSIDHVVAAWRDGFVQAGQHSSHRRRRHGSSAAGIPGERFVACAQNHDQVGNRSSGDRLSTLVPFAALKVAAASVLLSPYVPLLFMGEEWGERAPFPYFVDHSDPELVEAVRKGRREEFAGFRWTSEIPDPASRATFHAARIPAGPEPGTPGAALRDFHRELLRLRRECPALGTGRSGLSAWSSGERVLVVHRRRGSAESLLVLNHGPEPARLDAVPGLPEAGPAWRKALDAAAARWAGNGVEAPEALDGLARGLDVGPWGVLLYVRE